MEQLKRCRICHLPATYPGITFDERNACSLCRTAVPEKPYPGMEALQTKISSVLATAPAGRTYDAAVAFSGGRDSSYLLYFAKQVLGLSVLAITLEHSFMPDETLTAIENICTALEVDLHVIPNQALDECGVKCMQAWAKAPSAAGLVSLCTGCRYGIKGLIPQYCQEQGIPLLLVGNTRMEQMSYRQDLLALDPARPTALGKMVGYLRLLAKNPASLVSARCMGVQAYEFAYPYLNRLRRNTGVTTLAPFRDYVEAYPDDVTSALETMGWQHNACFRSQWRADCYVNIVRQYFYQRILGFNDLDVHYAQLLRTGQISMEDALARLSEENTFDPQVIADILRQHYGLELEDILAKL